MTDWQIDKGRYPLLRWPLFSSLRVQAVGPGRRETVALAGSPLLASRLQWSTPLFGGGGVSTVALAVSLAVSTMQPLLVIWGVVEVGLAVTRLSITWLDRISNHLWSSRRRRTLVLLELIAAASVGFGSAAAVSSGSPLGIVLGWMTGTAFAGENCVRNVGSLRLTQATIAVGVLPLVFALALSGEGVQQAVGALTSLFAVRMMYVVHSLNTVLVATMRAERESDHRARHDNLTGLLNRAGLERELELLRRDNPGANLTLFYIDLDRFKRINDTTGHGAGDAALRLVADGLLSLVGNKDIAARVGGDEFVVVSVLNQLEASEYGSAIQGAIARGGGHERDSAMTASIGTAQTSIHGDDLSTLMNAADVRLYQAKRAGGNLCVVD